MNIKELLDLTCYTVANMIKGKSPEEIRKAFNIKVSTLSFLAPVSTWLLTIRPLEPQNDFTPEEEEEVRREHQWAFD